MRCEDQDKKLFVSKKGYELVQQLFGKCIESNGSTNGSTKGSEELLPRTMKPYRYGDSFISSRNGYPLSVGQLIKLDQGYLVLLGESEGRVLAAKFARISERIEADLTMNDIDQKDFRGFWIFHVDKNHDYAVSSIL